MHNIYRFTKLYHYYPGLAVWRGRMDIDVRWLTERFGPSGNSTGLLHARWGYIDNSIDTVGMERTFYFPDAGDYSEFVLVCGTA